MYNRRFRNEPEGLVPSCCLIIHVPFRAAWLPANFGGFRCVRRDWYQDSSLPHLRRAARTRLLLLRLGPAQQPPRPARASIFFNGIKKSDQAGVNTKRDFSLGLFEEQTAGDLICLM